MSQFNVRGIGPCAGLIFCLALAVAAGCGGDTVSAGITCGGGTTAKDGTCVPVVGACGPGTTRQGDTCVPSCADGKYWDGAACATPKACAVGTQLDTTKGTCVPICPDGKAWDGAACASAPACGPGTVADADGGCVPAPGICGEGTVPQDGGCVPVLKCGTGTHIDNGACVIDTLPDADVVEAPVDGEAAEFNLPSAGGTVVVGGTIDLPADKNADGASDGDWDAFTFEAPAGAWLRVTAASDGAALPAFLVDSEDQDGEGNVIYRRIGMSPSSAVCTREVYLPNAGRYRIWVTDYKLLAAGLFQQPVVPIGGPAFTYRVTIKNLGAPQPVPITLPFEAVHDLADGALAFFEVSGLAADQIVEILERTIKPDAQEEADVLAALQLKLGSGAVREYVSNGTWEAAASLAKIPSGGGVMVVRDFMAVLGAKPQVKFIARALAPTDCKAQSCTAVTVTDQQDLLLSWPLAAGDFFVEGTYFDENGGTMVHHALLDGALASLVEPALAYPGQMASAWAYADAPTTFYLWLRWGDGLTTSAWQVEAVQHKTGAIGPGSKLVNQPLFESPPYTLRPAGIQHLFGQGGKVVFLAPRSTTGAGWVAPNDMIWDKKLQQVGPVMDVTAWNFPDGFATPLFTYVKDNGHYLYYLYDQGGDPTGGTYDIQMSSFATTALGKPAVGTPVSKDLQSPNGRNFYTFEANRHQPVDITVSPVLASDILPEIWVMNFGKAEFGWISYEWNASPDAPQLGIVVSETAPAALKPFTTRYVSPYDGLSVLLVMDAGGNAGPLDMFKVQLAVPPVPANDTCQGAEALTLAGGKAHVEASTLGAIDDVPSLTCVGYYSPGPDTFYKLDLAAGDTVEVTADSKTFALGLYLLTGCADPAKACVAGGAYNPAVMKHTAAAAGTYYIGVDGLRTGGDFTLDVTVNGR